MFRFTFLAFSLVASTSAFAWTQALPTFLGHEELTALAVERVGDGFFSPVSFNELASSSDNALILGNFAMDFPTGSNGGIDRYRSSRLEAIDNYIDSLQVQAVDPAGQALLESMRSSMKVSVDETRLELILTGNATVNGTGDNWQHAAEYQPLHFLVDPNLGEAASCAMSKAVIRSMTKGQSINAASLMEGDGGLGTRLVQDLHLYTVGAALHIIQDSFSPAHTRRSGSDFQVIEGICVFGFANVLPGLCQHEELDERDIIWASQDSRTNYPFDSFEALKPEAKAAVLASADFLRMHRQARTFARSRLDLMKQRSDAHYDRYAEHEITITELQEAWSRENQEATDEIHQYEESLLSQFFSGAFGCPGN